MTDRIAVRLRRRGGYGTGEIKAIWQVGDWFAPSVPAKYFTFDTEAEANTYGEQWHLMKMANIAPPAEMLKPVTTSGKTIGYVVRQWASSGLAAPSQQSPLGSLMTEVGEVKLADANYAWLSTYVQRLKVKNNLAPNSIRHRIQALGRSIDEYLRHNPDVVMQNPVRLLPKGYSTYTELDQKLAEAAGGAKRVDATRDRRLHAGEEERISTVAASYRATRGSWFWRTDYNLIFTNWGPMTVRGS